MDNHEITHNVPPTPPRTEGRKKIRIARIEDTRSRQVTFLKRKNGLLKKAMELGILCDCEVAVIIFNTNNGKLFEYSSVETEKVLQRYATYSGPSERRKKEHFFDLSKSKGTSNIPLNEPSLAHTAMNAAAAASRRPRPTYKFSTNEEHEASQEYGSNGRKLSSGETPVGPFPIHPSSMPSTSQIQTSYEDSAKRQKLSHGLPPAGTSIARSGVVPPIQLPDLVPGRPSFMPFTPRFSSNFPAPIITPNTASRQISAAFGLPNQTPKMSGLTPASNYNRNMFNATDHVQQESEVNEIATSQHQHQTQQPFSIGTDGIAKPDTQDFSVPPQSQPLSAVDDNITKTEEAQPDENQVQLEQSTPTAIPEADREYSAAKKVEPRPVFRVKPNLRVQIPEPNREDFAMGTPSGLNSITTPSSGDEHGVATLQVPRLNAVITSPNGAWSGWNSIGTGDRDGPVPLTPFLNMDTLAGSSDVGHGHLALPSPTDAGLIPLTPRGFGLESLLSARTSTRSQELGKRPFDALCEQNRPADPRRPFS